MGSKHDFLAIRRPLNPVRRNHPPRLHPLTRMSASHRLHFAARYALRHLLLSLLVAMASAAVVFGLWYPAPYRQMLQVGHIYLLVLVVDVVCGPLLTLVLYNPAKPRAELWRDLGLVVLIQLAALGYGLHTVWQARPVYLVQEVDRFKVIALPALDTDEVDKLPPALKPRWMGGPTTVAIREPKGTAERNKVLFESIEGGRDYAERPEFYLPYEGAAALKALQRAKPLAAFLDKQPSQRSAAAEMAASKGLDMAQLVYLPVVGRQDWVAVLDAQAQIQGFLKGDGF